MARLALELIRFTDPDCTALCPRFQQLPEEARGGDLAEECRATAESGTGPDGNAGDQGDIQEAFLGRPDSGVGLTPGEFESEVNADNPVDQPLVEPRQVPR